MYKLLIVDDEPLVQVGIQSMLNWAELNIEVCGIAMNGKAALEIIEHSLPDIVITDIKMPIMSGLELIKICRERYGTQKPAFIILTSYEDFHMAREALTYQVTDYLVKLELTAQTLRDAIQKILVQKQEEASEQNSPLFSATDFRALSDKFFIRLLHNLFDCTEQFLMQSKDLGLVFNHAGYVCSYVEIVSHLPENMPIDKQVNLYGSTLQMLKEIIIKYVPSHVISLDLKHFAILFMMKSTSDNDNMNHALKHILSTVNDTLHKYYNVELRLGIGSLVTTPSEISDSYQSARQAFAMISSDCLIAVIDECEDKRAAGNLFNVSVFKNALSRVYEEFDADTLYITLTQITDLFQSNPSHYIQAMDCACNILYLSISLLPNGEQVVSHIFDKYPDNYRSLYKQSNMEQIISWICYFRDSLCELFLSHKKDHKNHIVCSVKKYIAEHVREHVSLNEVAAVFGISPNYLSQLFKKFNDMGFTEYVTYLKISEAKTLLTDSSYKVYEIADLLGFESAFYFSKVFKKVEGIAPTEYQNKVPIGETP